MRYGIVQKRRFSHRFRSFGTAAHFLRISNCCPSEVLLIMANSQLLLRSFITTVACQRLCLCYVAVWNGFNDAQTRVRDACFASFRQRRYNAIYSVLCIGMCSTSIEFLLKICHSFCSIPIHTWSWSVLVSKIDSKSMNIANMFIF